MMTASERAEYERREAIRVARYEAFCARVIRQNREAEAKGRRVCERQLRDRQLVLEYSI